MRFSSLKFFIKDAINSMVRNLTISLASLFTITITLFILGMVGIIFTNANHFLGSVEKKIEVNVYLLDTSTQEEKNAIETAIKSYKGVSDSKFITKEDAQKEFNEALEKNGNNGIESDAAPFPELYRVSFKNMEVIKEFISYIGEFSGVEEAKTDAVVIEALMNFSNKFTIISIFVILIFVILSLSLIINNIKLAVFSRRKEIGIMKFVGATDWFIRWPFIIEGMIIGILGAIISTTVLYNMYKYVVVQFGENQLVSHGIVIFPGIFIFLLIGISIGIVGSIAAMKKFLKV